MTKKKKAAAAAKANAGNGAAKPKKTSKRAEKAQAARDRRAHKLAVRRQKQPDRWAGMWDGPAPAHLVAKLDVPRVNSKYQSYFEFAPNPEKKDKKLEFQVTNDENPPPGFVFVPVGDPMLTKMCKELSREKGAMIFIVSSALEKEQLARISDHVHRTGYHFREMIVDEAREIVGETAVSQPIRRYGPNEVEPIPESQEEINKQADNGILDLFPRIPNTDRTMILEHAFKKGAMFHGEPTVGLQPGLPLSRRVQLAVLAHIRHVHTRYDKLLRETSWVNARKAVEPVCLDIIVKWRGDEETGRDQMDEIMREVVIITDSEDEGDSSDDDDSSDESSEEDGEVTSASSMALIQQPIQKPAQKAGPAVDLTDIDDDDLDDDEFDAAISSRTRSKRDKKAQRGFKRYQAAWEEAKQRQQYPSRSGVRTATPLEETSNRRPRSSLHSPLQGVQRPALESRTTARSHLASDSHRDDHQQRYVDLVTLPSPAAYRSHRGQIPGPSTQRIEVISRPFDERAVYYRDAPPRHGAASYPEMEEMPSQVVRGSSAAQLLKDMLVPSVEPAISNVSSPGFKEPLGDRDSVNYTQDPGPRRVLDHSPAPRPRAIIDDSSPRIKRQRLIREDDAGHFRPRPARDISLSATHDSHLMSTSSAYSGEFPIQQHRVQLKSTQGLFGDNQPSYMIDPVTSERLPVYDASESGYFNAHPGYSKRLNDESPGPQQQRPVRRHLGSPQPSRDHAMEMRSSTAAVPDHMSNPMLVSSDRNYSQRPRALQDGSETLDMMRRDRHLQEEQGYSRRSERQRPLSPAFPVSRTISHSYGAGSSSMAPEQDIIHTFSHTHSGAYAPRARDGFTILAERPPQSFVDYGHEREHATRSSFASVPPSARARSPLRYVERPVQYRDEQRQPTEYYEHNVPHARVQYVSDERRYVPHERLEPYGQRQLPQGEAPTYVRTVEPRRQIIVLE